MFENSTRFMVMFFVLFLLLPSFLFQTKLEIQKALEEDATVYEYDSIYDEMQQQKKESNASLLSGKDDKKVDT